MSGWPDLLRRIESFEDVRFDPGLVHEMEARRGGTLQATRDVHFFTPTFKRYQSSELSCCSKAAWPALSITGPECKLQCDHCKAKVLAPMIPARSPEALWAKVNDLVARGARGMLLTGGSNRRNEVEYGPFLPTVRRLKDSFPGFRIAVHTALLEGDAAQGMAEAGIDVAMMDVIGAQETVTQVYHLKRRVEDFERTLEALVATPMKVVPHIVLGLHYGHLLGEWEALAMIGRHRPDALVLVVVMPFYATARRPFATPASEAVGRFFLDARRALPGIPLLLGCARPAGLAKAQIDAYAILAGLDGIAHPANGVVELAARLGRRVKVTASCCSLGVSEELMALEGDGGVEVDLDAILAEERLHHSMGHAASSVLDVQQPVGKGGGGR